MSITLYICILVISIVLVPYNSNELINVKTVTCVPYDFHIIHLYSVMHVLLL